MGSISISVCSSTMASSETPKPATRSSKRNKRPSSPVLEFLSNARKKRGGGSNKESTKEVKAIKPLSVVTSTSSQSPNEQLALSIQASTEENKVSQNSPLKSNPEESVKAPTRTATSAVTAAPVVTQNPDDQPLTRKPLPFKNPHFTHLGRSHSAKKTKTWKSLKQILATERTSNLNTDHVTYGTVDAPPSFKPSKKYSDLSGFEAKYTDPQTKLRFSTPQEFAQLRILPSDTVSGLLSLRRANLEVS